MSDLAGTLASLGSPATASLTVGGALSAAARAWPDRRGFIFRDREITFGELDALSDRFAARLLGLGFRRGDRLAINALNQPEWLVAYFGAAKIGVVTIGLNVRYRDVELEFILNQSETRAVVSVERVGQMDYEALFHSLRSRLPSVVDLLFIGPAEHPPREGRQFAALLEGELDPSERAALEAAKSQVLPDDPVIVIYTSGTTGRPKGAAITHKSQLAAARAESKHVRATSDDIIVLALPFNHVGGITCGVITMLLAGGTSLLLPMFDAADMIAQATKWSATVWAGVPTMHTLLLMNPAFAHFDTSKIRLVITGGSNAEPGLLTKLIAAFPRATVMNLYGLSESSGAVVMSAWQSDFDTLLKSIGTPLDGMELQVINEHGKAVPRGTIGELQFKGEAIAAGYFRDAEATAPVFDAEGWLRTGDLGYVDDGGNIILMGRLKEMYIQGGFNIYPVEVENLIARHPCVQLVAGLGIPDPVMGEIGLYYILPRPGTEPTEAEILSFCREHLADYKVPRQIVFRKEFPLTPAGKIMKSRLREELHIKAH